MAVRIRNLEGKATQKVPSRDSYNHDVSVHANVSGPFKLGSQLDLAMPEAWGDQLIMRLKHANHMHQIHQQLINAAGYKNAIKECVTWSRLLCMPTT